MESEEGAVDIIYHVAHYSWSTPGFNFTVGYEFVPATICGDPYHTAPAGKYFGGGGGG